MAHRDVLGEVLLQMENLKLSSPLRREQNEDDNKENILGGQDIPNIKTVDTTSCTSTLPILPPRDKTPTQLNGTKINCISVNAHERPESTPELRKSLQSSEVEIPISPAANFGEKNNKLTCQNGILEQTITNSEIEFDVHLDVTSQEDNATFFCEKNNSEFFLNSTFNVNDGVNVIVKNLENSDHQESVKSTLDFGRNEYILDICDKEDPVNIELELGNSEDQNFRSIENVPQGLNTINESFARKHIDTQKLIDCITLLDPNIKLVVASAEQEKPSSVNNSVQIETFLDSDKSDIPIESEVGDSFENTQNLNTYIEIETSELAEFKLDDSPCEDLKEGFGDENSSLKSVNSSLNRCEAEISDIKEDTIVLNNSSTEISNTEKSPNISLQKIVTDSKEVSQGNLVSILQNINTEGERSIVCNQPNFNEPENCNNLSDLSNCEEFQIFNEVRIKESITSDTSNISEVEPSIKSIDCPQDNIKNENLNLLKNKQNKIENQRLESDAVLEDKFGNCKDSIALISDQAEVQNILITGYVEQSSIDSHIETNSANQVVEKFEKSSEVSVKAPQIDIDQCLHSNSLNSEVESHSGEYSQVNCSGENILTHDKGLFNSCNELQPHNVTIVNEPEECKTDDSKIETIGIIECPSPRGFEETSASTISCEEKSCESGKVQKLANNTVEEVDNTSGNINFDSSHEKEGVQTVEKPELDKTQIYEEILVHKTSDIPKINDVNVRKMTEINENLQQEISDLKLELNAAQQAKATLELEIGKKDAIILKTQAECIKKEQQSQHDIKVLKEQLKEKSSINEKDSIKELEEALKESRIRESQAVSELNARSVDVLNYRKIMEEYEKTIATRFADFQKLKEENETVTRHLANLELSFSDLHQKYERTKTIIHGLKNNEDKLRKSFAAFEDSIHKQEERYESLKAHAKAQIEKSNKEIIKYKEKYESEVNKLNAIIKRLEIKSAALETSLDQKTKECIALSALCDEVTGKKV